VKLTETPCVFENLVGSSFTAVQPQPAVDIRRVEFTYDGSEFPALRGVNLALRPGEMVGIMGASGAGKSTLAKCLNRLVPAFEDGNFGGIVRICGRPLDGASVSEVAPIVGMVFQDFEAQLFSTNATLEVAFTMQQIGMRREEIASRIGPALAAVGLAGFEHRDPTTLSGGEKQRLAIAAVLAIRPAVIVLDEPTSDLDPDGKAEVFALIRKMREQGLSLIIIEHEAAELRECDRIIVLREGEIAVEGAPAAVMTQLEALERCGVHPPDLNRVLAMLGIHAHAASLDQAEALIRRAFPQLVDLRSAPSAENALDSSATTGASSAAVKPALVEAQELCFAYQQGPRVLDRINLRIEAGEFVAIVGRNGSGKTTLAKHLVGLLRPVEGRILLEGRDRSTVRPAETAQLAGYVFQNPDHQIFAATVEAEVAFGPRNFGLSPEEVEQRVSEVLRAVNLEGVRGHDPFLLGKGQRQRLAVASVLALRPRLLILDEPTTGLDYPEQQRMMRLIAELNHTGITIIIITHTPWLVAEYARRVILMRAGHIKFDGQVADFFQQDELLRQSSFHPPEATMLARRFGILALRPEELVAALMSKGGLNSQPC
jgi:energy-coupling factor transport system ATP-binding protein